jgi:hypothetical protein
MLAADTGDPNALHSIALLPQASFLCCGFVNSMCIGTEPLHCQRKPGDSWHPPASPMRSLVLPEGMEDVLPMSAPGTAIGSAALCGCCDDWGI